MTTLEGDVGTLQTEMTTVQGEVSTLQTDMGTLQTDVTVLETENTMLRARVDDLEAKGLVVFDANDTKVGDVISVQSDTPTATAIVLLNEGGFEFLLKVVPNRFLSPAGGTNCCFYRDATCSTTPYVPLPLFSLGDGTFQIGSLLFPVVRFGHPGTTVYFLNDPHAVAESFTSESQLLPDGSCRVFSSPKGNFFPVIQGANLDSLYDAPFRVLPSPQP